AVAGGQLAAQAWWRTCCGCPRWCSRRAACGGWRAAGGARVAAARGGARGARPAVVGGQLAAQAWWRTRGGCPRWCSRRA
ncbi:unnamed protein product, partial [Prorocentrum cordatum]